MHLFLAHGLLAMSCWYVDRFLLVPCYLHTYWESGYTLEAASLSSPWHVREDSSFLAFAHLWVVLSSSLWAISSLDTFGKFINAYWWCIFYFEHPHVPHGGFDTYFEELLIHQTQEESVLFGVTCYFEDVYLVHSVDDATRATWWGCCTSIEDTLEVVDMVNPG